MSLTATELRKLATLKLSPAQMAGVLELMALRAEREEALVRAEQERKAADAARKREERAARKSKNVQGPSMDSPANVQGQSEDCPEDVQRTPSPLVPPFPPAPPIPPIIPPSRSGSSGARDLETKLRQAAGWENELHPGLIVTGPIEELLATGADLELDVLPVIRGRAQNVRRPSGWKYFIGPIQDAVAARKSAATGPPLKLVNGSRLPEKTFEELAQELVPGWIPGTKSAGNSA